MQFLYDNIVTMAVAVVACAFAWIFGGTVAEYLTPVMPWLWAILFEVMLCFPQRRSSETTYDARKRVWFEMKSDPFTWVAFGFVMLLLIPFVNKGLCPICDYAEININGVDPSAPIPFIPYCVNRLQHFTVVVWFVPALTAALAVRHSLLKRGKRLLIEIIVWNGLALAVLGAIQQVSGAKFPLWADFPDVQPVYFFSTFGYPNMGGDYFTTLFGLAVGLWRWKLEIIRSEVRSGDPSSQRGSSDKSFWRKHYLLVPAVIFFFSALNTLSRAAIILVSLMAVLFFVHTFVSAFVRMPKANRVKASAASLLVLIAIALCTVAFMPDDIQREVETLNTAEVLDRVTGRGQYHSRVAVEVWKDNFLFGCGGWGYKHFCIPKMMDDEIRQLQSVGGINVHNDYLQFLAEHGLVGFGCLVALVVMLVWPLGRVWKALLTAVRFTPPKEQPAKPHAIFVLPAPVFCILMTALATFVHGFGDCPLRSPAVLTLFFVSLAAMDGFLPRLKDNG
ncbi:MAG: O-antigen ligase family protein [Kiritimatiellae bacterium]|nr:O-antigen ligase family protein [Kiritimatiellia bacterium]